MKNDELYKYLGSKNTDTSQAEDMLKTKYEQKYLHSITEMRKKITEEVQEELIQAQYSTYRQEMQKVINDCESTKTQYLTQIQTQAEKILQEHILKLNEESNSKLSVEREKIKAECIKELRSEKDKTHIKKLTEKMTPIIEKEVRKSLMISLEPAIRVELETKYKSMMEDMTNKQSYISKRKLIDRENSILEKIKTDANAKYIKDVEEKAKEIADCMNKDFQIMTKKQTCKEVQELYDKIQSQFIEERHKEIEDVKREKTELGQSKSKLCNYIRKAEKEKLEVIRMNEQLRKQLNELKEEIRYKNEAIKKLIKHKRASSIIDTNRTIIHHNTKLTPEKSQNPLSYYDSIDMARQLIQSAEVKAKAKVTDIYSKSEIKSCDEGSRIFDELDEFKQDVRKLLL